MPCSNFCAAVFDWICVVIIAISSRSDTTITVVSQLLELNHTCELPLSLTHSQLVTAVCLFVFCLLFFVFLTHSLVLYVLLHLLSLKWFVVDLLIFCFVCAAVFVVIIVMRSSSDTKVTEVSQLLELNHSCCQSLISLA